MAKVHRNYKYYNVYFNGCLQFCVETINGNDVAEVGVGLENMTLLVNLHRPPIIGQTKIACPVKDGQCLNFVINNKPSLLQSLNLLNEGNGLLGNSILKNEVPACCTPRERTCAGIYCLQRYDFIS